MTIEKAAEFLLKSLDSENIAMIGVTEGVEKPEIVVCMAKRDKKLLALDKTDWEGFPVRVEKRIMKRPVVDMRSSTWAKRKKKG